MAFPGGSRCLSKGFRENVGGVAGIEQKPRIYEDAQGDSVSHRQARCIHDRTRLIAGFIEVQQFHGVNVFDGYRVLFVVIWGKKGVKVSPLFCDKLSFVIPYTELSERKSVRERLIHLKYNSEGHYAHEGGKAKYKLGMYFYVEPYERVDKMLIQADPKFLGDHFIRVDYNAVHADPGAVHWLLNQILPGGWMDIHARAVCTRFDATVDVIGIDVADLLVYYPKMQRSRVFCKGGKTETYELGGYAGDKHIVV